MSLGFELLSEEEKYAEWSEYHLESASMGYQPISYEAYCNRWEK